jgi:hypothetical protein
MTTSTTKTVKAANYTEAQIATLTSSYKGVDNKKEVAMIAAEVGKSVASVRAKLSSLGLYKTAEAAKSAKSVKKVDIVAAIKATGVKLSEAEMEGLTKATSAPLEKILAALTNRK